MTELTQPQSSAGVALDGRHQGESQVTIIGQGRQGCGRGGSWGVGGGGGGVQMCGTRGFEGSLGRVHRLGRCD